MNTTDDAAPRSAWALWFVILALCLLLAIGTWTHHRSQEREIRTRVEERLTWTARLKGERVAAWRRDQEIDAPLIASHRAVPLRAGDSGEGAEALLRRIAAEHEYEDLSLVEPGGAVAWSLKGQRQLPQEVSDAVSLAAREQRTVLVDYTSEAVGLALTTVVPLTDEGGTARLMVFTNDASRFLRPVLSSRPSSSRSGETLLIRRDGALALIVEGSGVAPGSAVQSVPLADADNVLTRAALGERGIVMGRDQRGVEVLAAIEPIPRSPLVLVSKLDVDEALAAWRTRSRSILGVFLLLSTSLITTTSLVSQRRRQAHARALYRAEAQRRALAQRHATTLRAIGDAVIVADAQARVELLNAEAERLTGWTDAEARGRPLGEVFRIFAGGTGEPAESPADRVLREGVVVGLANHTFLQSRDGTARPIADSGAPVKDEEGRVNGVVLVFRDESERYAQEEVLRASEARCRTILESAPDAIFVQVAGRFAYANLAAARLLQAADPKALLDRPVLDRFDPAQHASIGERIRTLNVERRAVPLEEETILTLAGEPVPVEATAVPIDFEGRAGALVFVRDISLRKQQQAEHERLTKAIEQLSESVVITDAQGTIRYVNLACLRITGYAREELVGQNPRILRSGEQDQAFYAELWRTILGGKTWRGQLRNRRKDGSLYTVEAAITPLHESGAEPSGFISVQLDVTGRLELEEQLRHAQRLSAIGQLAGGVAHDFNNLLTVITGYCQLAASNTSADAALKQYLANIARASDRAAGLTRQLLAFSRKQVLQPRVLDVSALVESMSELLRRLLGEDIDMFLNLRKGLRRVEVDPGQLEQVVMNLAVNARDAMPRGGKLTITTEDVDLDESYARTHPELRPGPYLLLAVSDTGEGMSAETQARIFEPFFTTKAQGKGTGLGLATVHGIVNQSQGHIWVYSEVGRGTTFKVYLPQARGNATEEQAGSTRKPDAAGGHETILVVEDEEGVRELIRDVLEGGGYRVVATDDVDEALRVCRDPSVPLHLLLTDVVLPKLGGRELAERAQAARPGLKIVYMSGYTDDAIVHHGVLEHGTPFISKPFSPTELLQRVRGYLS